jgi:hypothetical protein
LCSPCLVTVPRNDFVVRTHGTERHSNRARRCGSPGGLGSEESSRTVSRHDAECEAPWTDLRRVQGGCSGTQLANGRHSTRRDPLADRAALWVDRQRRWLPWQQRELLVGEAMDGRIRVRDGVAPSWDWFGVH